MEISKHVNMSKSESRIFSILQYIRYIAYNWKVKRKKKGFDAFTSLNLLAL